MTKKHIKENKIVNNDLKKQIERHFLRIDNLISQKASLEFADINFADVKDYNHGIGTLIRLRYLRKKSELYKSFVSNGIYDKDKMTMVILEAYLKYKKSLKKSLVML